MTLKERKTQDQSVFFVTPFCRWKVHDDWVSQLKYYDSLRAVISCSNHPDTALVIGKLMLQYIVDNDFPFCWHNIH